MRTMCLESFPVCLGGKLQWAMHWGCLAGVDTCSPGSHKTKQLEKDVLFFFFLRGCPVSTQGCDGANVGFPHRLKAT